MKRALLESLTTSWPPSPFRLDQLPWDFLIPSTASLGLAPSGVGCPFPPRFRSQVFATSQRFPSMPELRSLVSCRSHSWDRPFRAFPSQELRTPLGVACSLAVIYRVLGRAARTFSPAVSPTPESLHTRWPGSPSGYELPFLGPRSNLSQPVTALTGRSSFGSWSPWVRGDGLGPFRDFTCFEASRSSCESVHVRRELPHAARPLLSWVSAPPELSPSTARGPVDPPGDNPTP